MSKKQVHKTKYLAVFAITTLIFLIGIIIGNYTSSSKLEGLEDIENELRMETMAMELQYLLLSEDPCKNTNSTVLSEELYKLGSKLDYMEEEMGVNDPTVLRLKEYFSLLQIRHWLFSKRTKKECSLDQDFILYFYSNKGDCRTCEEQGYVLSFIREKTPSTKIYAFDINIKNPAVDTLKKMYIQNQTTPILIINDHVFYGFKNKEAIEQILKIKRY
ncbi:hypothetical protein GF361_04235 [Candidatus Woesearchaeota archaeon]|nr:hypothetical protein [Candidatus Woesearchaeota archaeon]